jgi:hypothetical protein
LNNQTSCGDAPLGVLPTVQAATLGGGAPLVIIKWSQSTDEVGGEKDVERYALYKRYKASTSFSEPFAAVPAGSATYSFTDTAVQSGDTLVYGVTAIDCTPTSSNIATAAAVAIP